MIEILSKVDSAFYQLLIALVVYIFWEFAKNTAEEKGAKKVLIEGLVWCVIICSFLNFSLGDPTCIITENEFRSSLCIEYKDDGFNPTYTDRATDFLYYFILLYVPIIVGAIQGRRSRR